MWAHWPRTIDGAPPMSHVAVHIGASLTLPALYFAGDDGRLEGDARREQELHVLEFQRSAKITETFGVCAEAEVSRTHRYVGSTSL